jgi:hypothetical protein
VLELVLKGGDPEKTVAVACSECRLVALNEQVAQQCCRPRVCPCGVEIDKRRGWTACDDCRAKTRAEEEKVRFNKAAKVHARDYTGRMIYSEGFQEFFTLDDYADRNECDDIESEEYVWGTVSTGISIDAESVVESALDDHHEDAYDQIVNVDCLQDAIDAWIAEQDVETFYADYNTAVVLT